MTSGPGQTGPDPFPGAQGPAPGAAAPGASGPPAGYGWTSPGTPAFDLPTAPIPQPPIPQPPIPGAPYPGVHAWQPDVSPPTQADEPVARARRGGKGGRHSAADRSGMGGFLRELPFLLVIGFGIVVLVKSFLIQAFYIPSGSMENSLEVNDRVLVNRQSYLFGEPQRGDVIVFRNWDDVGQDVDPESVPTYIGRSLREGLGLGPTGPKQDLIKRIVGLPGDTVEVRNSRAIVNGVPLDEPYVLVDGPDPLANFGPRVVPDGHYFMLGDHRNNSADSRANGGRFTDTDAIVGRAFLRIWPVGHIGGLGAPPTPQAAVPPPRPVPVSRAAGMILAVRGGYGPAVAGG